MRTIRIAAVVTLAAPALMIGIAPPAMAANSACTIAFFTTTCTTRTVPANTSSRDIWMEVQNCKGWAGGSTLHFKLQDVGTGSYFWHGSLAYGHRKWIRVTGLYGSYKLRLDGEPGSYGNLVNSASGWWEHTTTC
ncbi:hypothetical protein [Bailinhaonella thermotolerans]|uniref:Uncharacterized protein n=1 Tax=Bailinhaonella thermotolerans TaxID=1070861 RepID=A0A3A4BKE2_9ACTN|nr:hypothetical protein [Bailinhaonella thermotolerans]RJL35784.1 hypothetical protein D5H75_03095 [Bailinhaonella thermotolerans]